MTTDAHWMRRALSLAKKAEVCGEVPVGAVLVSAENIALAAGHNQPIGGCDPTLHAEIVVLREGAKATQNYRLINTTLYVTLEPCLMCVGAMIHARIKRLVFGAKDSKKGVCGSCFNVLGLPFVNHSIEVEGGCLARESQLLLQDFFARRRG